MSSRISTKAVKELTNNSLDTLYFGSKYSDRFPITKHTVSGLRHKLIISVQGFQSNAKVRFSDSAEEGLIQSIDLGLLNLTRDLGFIDIYEEHVSKRSLLLPTPSPTAPRYIKFERLLSLFLVFGLTIILVSFGILFTGELDSFSLQIFNSSIDLIYIGLFISGVSFFGILYISDLSEKYYKYICRRLEQLTMEILIGRIGLIISKVEEVCSSGTIASRSHLKKAISKLCPGLYPFC